MKHCYLLFPFLILLSCQQTAPVDAPKEDLSSILSLDPVVQSSFKLYSAAVMDSFRLFVSLPKDYHTSGNQYPVVYVLDANVLFEQAATVSKLLSVGVNCREAIYIGIGYNDLLAQDTLRDRDYTFPPSDSMPGSGGAKRFSAFLEQELIPYINSRYRTAPKENTLMGHSLGGYFVLYHLLSGALENKFSFKHVIAGSAFTYNDAYLLALEKEVSERRAARPVNLFLCSGAVEDNDSMQTAFSTALEQRRYKGLALQSVRLPGFDHMDALMATCSKGLREALKQE